MPEEDKTLIMKFGGAAIQTPAHFSAIADLIIRRSSHYPCIAIVISAMGGMTDHLITMAKEVHPSPPRREYDMLVSAGERMSIALLAMALSAKGREAVSFTGSQSGILTTSQHAEAHIIDVRPSRIISELGKKIVIVAGFQGVSPEKEITTLGRGGSDTTAVALAIALQAQKVEFYKDVGGIYEEDPKKNAQAALCPRLDYDRALEIVAQSGSKVLHPRAIYLAQRNKVLLHVLSLHSGGCGSIIFTEGIKPNTPIYENSCFKN